MNIQADSLSDAAASAAMRTEADRVSSLADDLSDANVNGGNVNDAALRLLPHLDGETQAALFPTRRAGTAADAAVGQTNAQAFARARGEVAPETPEVTQDLFRQIAERYSRSADVASASVRQRVEAWNNGDMSVHARDVNLEHVETTDEVKAFINAAVDMNEAAIRNIRGETGENTAIGLRTDAQRTAVAKALARDMGENPGIMMARILT
jgi:hypothetical protein